MRASALLMTVVQEKQGARKHAMPKGLIIVKRDTHNLDDMTLISTSPRGPVPMLKWSVLSFT
eukprot:6055590-Amphidinium_carterae.1